MLQWLRLPGNYDEKPAEESWSETQKHKWVWDKPCSSIAKEKTWENWYGITERE